MKKLAGFTGLVLMIAGTTKILSEYITRSPLDAAWCRSSAVVTTDVTLLQAHCWGCSALIAGSFIVAITLSAGFLQFPRWNVGI